MQGVKFKVSAVQPECVHRAPSPWCIFFKSNWLFINHNLKLNMFQPHFRILVIISVHKVWLLQQFCKVFCLFIIFRPWLQVVRDWFIFRSGWWFGPLIVSKTVAIFFFSFRLSLLELQSYIELPFCCFSSTFFHFSQSTWTSEVWHKSLLWV